MEVANDVAFNMGTHKEIGKWSFRAITENDQDVYDKLRGLTADEWEMVRMYYPKFTRTPRDLKNDLVKHLNESLRSKLPEFMK
ncbi:hypothetical protein BXY85_3752 [Roseivirga pacifica]|uniref:Uncharacterized protein n=2 Tax=Roseivirga pacifica TaxID=1267423 RepID=A0A1I0Q9I5_9BACT|nr:hypothetical protein BXY85_3752 [Roseivirga pacifica]SEW23454.1 hypothetical protein SAMN05216290_2123 [Roseivirga pacifica]